MSIENEDNSFNSENEYDEESFDNESIEEISDDDQSLSEVLTNFKSLSDKLSYIDEEDNDISSLNSNDEDNDNPVHDKNDTETVSEVQYGILKEDNEHEIDESDSEHAPMVDIAERVGDLCLEPGKSSPEPVSTDDVICPDNNFANYEHVEKKSDWRQSDMSFNVTTHTPTSFNSENHAFHMDIIKQPPRSNAGTHTRCRNFNRKNQSFSNERMREIERHNLILLRKILSQKLRKEKLPSPNVRVTSSAVNRNKQQRQIDLDNQVLKKKIEAIQARRRNNLHPL